MLSHLGLFAAPWTVAHQASLSMEFSRQEYWSGVSFPPPGDLPYPGIEPMCLYCRQILYCLRHQSWSLFFHIFSNRFCVSRLRGIKFVWFICWNVVFSTYRKGIYANINRKTKEILTTLPLEIAWFGTNYLYFEIG